jgi:hypothetical protein
VKAPGRSRKRLGRTARTVTDWRLSKDLSRETTVGGRDQQQELNSHDQLGRNPRTDEAHSGCACWFDLCAPRGTMIDSGLGPAKGPACDCCSICYLLAPVSCTPRVGPCAVDAAQMAAAAMALTAEAYDTTAVQTAARGAVRSPSAMPRPPYRCHGTRRARRGAA